MTKINLDITRQYNNDGEDSDEPYSYRGTTSGWVNGVTVHDDSSDYFTSYNGLATDLKPPFYVLYCEYETGDTFGSDYEASVIGVSKEYADMELLREEAEKFEGFGQLSNGYYVPWNGYFEHLIALTIAEVGGMSPSRKTYR
jgi:hypothetical protein